MLNAFDRKPPVTYNGFTAASDPAAPISSAAIRVRHLANELRQASKPYLRSSTGT